MGKFDTHGGYFAPQGYLRVNTGGSHDENPYGGVQLGVDPQGVPNMLEEGEPVYEDYVYSDNIKADGGLLKKNNIPDKYAGKLYSEIADAYVDEAVDRPNDPISNNGLEVMLGRLAKAQDEQKEQERRKELEDEISQLSPEEIAQLEAMLSQGEDAQAGVQQTGQEQAAPPGQMQQPPVMADGGFIRRLDEGTPGKVIPFNVNPETGRVTGGQYMPGYVDVDGSVQVFDPIDPSVVVAFPGRSQAWVEGQVGPGSIRRQVTEGMNQFVDDAYDMYRDNTAAQIMTGSPGIAVSAIDAAAHGDYLKAALLPVLTRTGGRMLAAMGRGIGRGARSVGTALRKLPEFGGRRRMLKEAGDAVKASSKAVKEAGEAAEKAAAELKAAKAASKANPSDATLVSKVEELEAKSRAADDAFYKASAKAAGSDVVAGAKTVGAFTTGPLYNRAAYEAEVEGLRKAYEVARKAAEDSPDSKALKDAAEVARKALEKAEGNWNKWWKHGEWQVKGAIGGAAAGTAIASGSDGGHDWVDDQFEGFKAGGGYIRRFGTGTPGEKTAYRPDGTEYKIGDVSEQLGTFFGYDENGEPIWLQTVELDPSTVIGDRATGAEGAGGTGETTTKASDAAAAAAAAGSVTSGPESSVAAQGAGAKDKTDKGTDTDAVLKTAGMKPLPTWPRYMGAVNSGLLGLYDVFQEPDRYDVRRLQPTLPSGQMHLIDPVYNPIDESMAVNDVLAGGAGTIRALANSGLGPSTAAAIVAAGNNIGMNVGAARTQVRDANNQRRNQVISQRNANAQALGKFDYGISKDRAQILNDAQIRDIQNELMRQRLNYESEGEKYSAISSQLDSVGKAISDIGKQNFYMNQIALNPAYDYVMMPDGRTAFIPKTTKEDKEDEKDKRLGGTLLRRFKN